MFEKLIQFFQTRLIKIGVQPEIEVDFHTWSNDEAEDALKKEWEKLLEELKQNPSLIKKRKWNSYGSEDRYEEILVEIDGVRLKLSGSHYPDPDYHRASPRQELSVQQQADEQLDRLIEQNSLISAITNASRVKVITLLEVVRAAAGEKRVDPEIVSRVTEEVLKLLSLSERVQKKKVV